MKCENKRILEVMPNEAVTTTTKVQAEFFFIEAFRLISRNTFH